MNIVALSGSIAGSKTRTAMDYTVQSLQKIFPEAAVTLLDLADHDIQFSDGRHYLDYDGDTGYVVRMIMEADALVIGTPVFQASIPAPLKNVFDLLPGDGLRDKTVSMIVTAGSAKHYLIAEQQLKPILAYMKAEIVQGYVFIEEENFHRKEIVNDDVLFRIDRLVEDTKRRAEVTAGDRVLARKSVPLLTSKQQFSRYIRTSVPLFVPFAVPDLLFMAVNGTGVREHEKNWSKQQNKALNVRAAVLSGMSVFVFLRKLLPATLFRASAGIYALHAGHLYAGARLFPLVGWKRDFIFIAKRF